MNRALGDDFSPFVLIGNKADRESERVIQREEVCLNYLRNTYMETSALNNMNMDKSLVAIAKAACSARAQKIRIMKLKRQRKG